MSHVVIYLISYNHETQGVTTSLPLAKKFVEKFVKEKEFDLKELTIEQWIPNLYGSPFKIIPITLKL